MSVVRAPQKVLITNDDGPKSIFLEHFVKRLHNATLDCNGGVPWKSQLCIPAENQSFSSKAVSHGPLEVMRHTREGKGCDNSVFGEELWIEGATPAACVNLALGTLFRDAFDLVISGPNIGHNLGRSSILSSGTVGAVVEASMMGVRGIALSFPFTKGFNNWTDDEVEKACDISAQIVIALWNNWPAHNGRHTDVYFNVNIPLGEYTTDKPLVQLTSVSDSAVYKSLFKSTGDNQGKELYHWSPEGLRVWESCSSHQSRDVDCVQHSFASVTPLVSTFQGGLNEHDLKIVRDAIAEIRSC